MITEELSFNQLSVKGGRRGGRRKGEEKKNVEGNACFSFPVLVNWVGKINRREKRENDRGMREGEAVNILDMVNSDVTSVCRPAVTSTDNNRRDYSTSLTVCTTNKQLRVFWSYIMTRPAVASDRRQFYLDEVDFNAAAACVTPRSALSPCNQDGTLCHRHFLTHMGRRMSTRK